MEIQTNFQMEIHMVQVDVQMVQTDIQMEQINHLEKEEIEKMFLSEIYLSKLVKMTLKLFSHKME